MEEGDTIKVLVCGQIGTGKSTLCNAIIGKNVFPTGENYEPITEEPQESHLEWQHDNCTVKISVIDTPGFGGGENDGPRFDQITNVSGGVDIILYCIDSGDTSELHNDKVIIGRLKVICKNIIIALTKSDTILHGREFPQETLVQNYLNKLQDLIKILSTNLLESFDHLPVPVVTTANIELTMILPGVKFSHPWILNLFFEILNMMKKASYFRSLEEAHPYSCDIVVDLDEMITNRHTNQIPFVNVDSDTTISKKIQILLAAISGGGIAGATGATIGATIGALAIGLPTFGVAAGVGLVLGGGIGAAVGVGVGAGAAAIATKASSE